MQAGWRAAILAAALGGCAQAAAAQDIGYHSGALNAAVHGAVSVQTSAISGAPRFSDARQTNVDVYGRIVADWTSPQGWLLGANLETSTRRTTEALGSGQAYVYFSSDLGRIEVGKRYGPANSLSFHAPEIALGQIRGDFARYTGSQALMSAFDTQTAPKIVVLSAPIEGFRVGASWAPRDSRNAKSANPLDRTLQRDAVELGAQYQRPVGDWVLGASAGYVHGKSDFALTRRQDVSSYSLGAEARRGPLRLGAGYVNRGDSNLLVTNFHQHEVNAGAAWVTDRWGLAASGSNSRGRNYRNTLFGAGGYVAVARNANLRGDLVRFDERDGGLPRRKGWALISEIEAYF